MGHRLSKIVTKTGDTGTTGLGDGSRVPKAGLRINAIGDVDETNALIGVLLAEPLPPRIANPLTDIQHALFNLGGQLAVPGMTLLTAEHVEFVEQTLETLNADLPPLKEFVLPRGGRAASAAHVARVVCRRAERALWALAAEEDVAQELGQYLNRLSDLMFVIARHLARSDAADETAWQA